MNKINTVPDTSNRIDAASEQLSFEVALMAGKLAVLLSDLFAHDEKLIGNAVAFLEHAYVNAAGDVPVTDWQGTMLERLQNEISQPLEQLVSRLKLSEQELDLLILAGMAEEHEGYSDIFRTLHPQTQPRPTMGLAAQLFCQTQTERLEFRKAIEIGPLFNKGILLLDGDGPIYTRSLTITVEFWSLLHGIEAWPANIHLLNITPALYGLGEWFENMEVLKISQMVKDNLKCTIFISADNVDVAVDRAVSLAYFSGLRANCFRLPAEPNPEYEKNVFIHSLARGTIPILQISQIRPSQEPHLTQFEDYPGSLIVCAQNGTNISLGDRTFLSLSVERLSAAALRTMWSQTLPELDKHASLLAARYPVEPAQAQQVARDIAITLGDKRQPELADVAEFIRARSVTKINNSVQLIRPVARWEHLVLPESKLSQLQEAVNRLHLQAKVLDEWRFLEGRRGARGVRMLFAGPPGTGKTLSAEVMANSLDVDLLMVDLSRVVSKWIGETEKNLAEVFDTAENTKAVLLFDEADALFGKRTEISDAHDRYANLETAYLLSRLERYDGLAILSTNLQQNIDAAFTRRLEFIVEYQDPDRAQRLALWKCHLPDGVKLAQDVQLEELAAHFPIVGGLIRNAAVAAAFLAAADDGVIRKEHFIHAVRREYDKSGKAYRGMPGGRMKTVSGGK